MFEDADPRAVKLPWSRRAEAIRREYIQSEFTDLRAKSERFEQSLTGRLADELTHDAVARVAQDHNQRDYELDRLLEEARSLVFDLMYAATSHEQDWEKREVAQFWSHSIHPGNAIKNKSYKLMQRYDIEHVAQRYAASTVRSQLFDRTLVDMLLAFEVYTYGDEMFHPFQMEGLPARSPLKWPHPLWVFVRTAFFSTVILGAVGAAASWAMNEYIIGAWGGWIIGGAIVVWLLLTALHLVFLPWIWAKWSKTRKKARALMEAMLVTYGTMASDSVISAQHVLDNVKTSAALGVVWPSPVYVVLEDVIKRGGKL